ncbi:MAG: 3-dehydroquinate synthase [Bryobacterales bacterium]
MPRIPVETAQASYDVVVQAGALEQAGEWVKPLAGNRRLFVVADPQAWSRQGERLRAGLAGFDLTVLELQAGEANKRLSQVESLAERMYAAGADRSGCVVAFGGGIAGDIGGFVAASYMRGVDVIQIPTTLLAQVDAAIGGKTGVNLASGKNLLGAFHQPRLVLVDPTTLSTLGDREYRAGLFEVIKYGVIWSPKLFELMATGRKEVLAREPEILEALIAGSVRIKADVVKADEREGDLRRILNYGHTLGHTLEAETLYRRFLHGEAVAYGMIAAGRLAEALELLAPGTRQEIERTILDYGPVPDPGDVLAEDLVARVSGDKKTIGGRVHFVLASRIGQVQVVTNPAPNLVLQAASEALESLRAAAAETPGASRAAGRVAAE